MSSERRNLIKDYIEGKSEVKLSELIEFFPNCSAMTIRRDLIKLEEEGYIKRTRGGAIAMSRILQGGEGLYSQRAIENTKAKLKIARCALSLITRGHSLYLDAGSTLMCLAKLLPESQLIILTSGINIAQELARQPAFTVTTVGGQLNPNTLSCSGVHSLSFIDSVNIDIAVMGTSGYSVKSGFTSASYTEHALKWAVMSKARETIMLMDTSKIDRNMPFTFAQPEDINMLVVDQRLPDDINERMRDAGVDIWVADEM